MGQTCLLRVANGNVRVAQKLPFVSGLRFDDFSPRAVVPPMHLSTRHGWPDVHVVAVSCVTVSQSGDPKSEPPDVWRCYGASVAPVAPVLPAAAEMFLGAWQHGIVGEYPVNLYL